MATYRNTITGEFFTMDEIREAYEEFFWDMRLQYDNWSEWFDEMYRRGDFEKADSLIFKIRDDADTDKLTDDPHIHGLRLSMAQVYENANMFGMTANEFVGEFLEQVEQGF